jgi:beta-galactosidase
MVTARSSTRLQLDSDCSWLTADGQDVAYIDISVVDEQGVLVPGDVPRQVKVSVQGCGKLYGLATGDLANPTSYRSDTTRLADGRCQAIVQSTRDKGEITVEVECEGLPLGFVRLETR